jgi:hypothetical protein
MTTTADPHATPARPHLDPVRTPSGSAGPTPLWAVLTFTFLNSLGSGVVTTGIVFLAASAYGFGRTDNYWLGLLLGVTYIVGALSAGPLIRKLQAMVPGLSPRGILAGLMVIAGLLCAVPYVARAMSTSSDPKSGAWAVWVLVGIYGPLTGVLWPLVESFLSGGRSGKELRTATGRFNISWSSALVVAFVAMAPLVREAPLLVILLLGGVHIGSAALLAKFPPSPAAHVHEHHEPHPPVYASLLSVMRLLLPTSYVLYSALNPYLPVAFAALGIDKSMHTIVAATWLLARVITMVTFERMESWHGRWWVPIVGGLLLMAGFAMTVLSPQVGGGGTGIAVGVAGLVVFGVGMGVIYCAAIYYAMEVGSAEVDAGGTHEALIGVGYTLGPTIALLATAGVHYELLSESRFAISVVIGTGLFAAPVVILAIVRSLGRSEADR